MKSNCILIHFPKTVDVINHLNDLGLKYTETKDEYDVIVDDAPGDIVEEGYYQDPDLEICDHYGINYGLVNCIEAVY